MIQNKKSVKMEGETKTIHELIQDFYTINKFDNDGGTKKKIVWIKFGFISFPLPNFESRKENVHFHDINHIITGFDTTWKGESSISAWEVASGGWKNNFIPWLLTLWAMGLGILFYSKTTVNSFNKGLTMCNSLCCGLHYAEINSLTETELRNRLSELKLKNRNLLFWSIVSVIFFLAPFILIFFVMTFLLA